MLPEEGRDFLPAMRADGFGGGADWLKACDPISEKIELSRRCRVLTDGIVLRAIEGKNSWLDINLGLSIADAGDYLSWISDMWTGNSPTEGELRAAFNAVMSTSAPESLTEPGYKELFERMKVLTVFGLAYQLLTS
jgi:hypothetical protein